MDSGIQNLIFQIFLALALLRISGEIGKLSLHKGYASMMTAYSAGNLSFNLFFRVLYVPIAISLISILLFFFEKDFLTINIWATAVWYFLIQVVLSFSKLAYTNLILFIGSGLVSITLSYLFYVQGITKGLTALLPESGEMATELWILIIIFFYEIMRNRDVSPTYDEDNRRYEDKYLKLKTKYKPILKTEFLTNKILNDILFAIMIFEDFNRPKLFRTIERLLFGLGFVKTTGIMQIKSHRALDDFESVIEAQDIVMNIFNQHESKPEYELVGSVLVMYNPDAYYRQEVRNIYYKVSDASNKLEEGQYYDSNKDREGIIGGTASELQAEISSLINQINTLQTGRPFNPTGDSLVFPKEDTHVTTKPAIKIKSSYELSDRSLARGVAADLDEAGYLTLIEENDTAIFDVFSDDDDDYDIDIELTIEVGKTALTAGMILTLAFRGLMKGVFAEVGKDLYKVIKEKYFAKQTKPIQACFVELFVKTRSYTRSKNVRVYVYLSNEEECEKLSEALNMAEENIKDYENREVREVLYVLRGGRWETIEGNDSL